jgi:hypothetical protein
MSSDGTSPAADRSDPERLTDEELRERRRSDPALQERLREGREAVVKAMSDPDPRDVVTAEDLPAFLREFG